jgi:hypothetical protein
MIASVSSGAPRRFFHEYPGMVIRQTLRVMALSHAAPMAADYALQGGAGGVTAKNGSSDGDLEILLCP